jgi:hypothetical protein
MGGVRDWWTIVYFSYLFILEVAYLPVNYKGRSLSCFTCTCPDFGKSKIGVRSEPSLKAGIRLYALKLLFSTS